MGDRIYREKRCVLIGGVPVAGIADVAQVSYFRGAKWKFLLGFSRF